MKLVGSKTSPYVRKIRVLLAEKQLAFEFVEDNVWAPETKVPQWNPLIKVPALVLDDGEALFDSPVIAEYVDSLPGMNFIPAPVRERMPASRSSSSASARRRARTRRGSRARRARSSPASPRSRARSPRNRPRARAA